MAGCVSSGSMGCKHYQRYCKILAPCCNKVFSCRFCHNEVSDHSINRYNVKKVVCNMCNKMQNVAEKCINCKTPFGLVKVIPKMAGCVSSGSMGCKHYQRYCKILAPCCNKVFSCRFCHNEVSDHSINRYNVKKVVCNMCNKMQNVAEKCINCKTPFGLYVCLLCNLFDNEDKEQFHCYGCGLCRIGGKQNYFHCDKCDFCYAWRLHDNHTCVEKASQRDCPICVEDLHTSRTAAHVPPCGHLIHEHCFQRVQSEYKSCILCRKPY